MASTKLPRQRERSLAQSNLPLTEALGLLHSVRNNSKTDMS
jgi:hypothetical protein